MKLLDAGEVVPDDTILDLVAAKLAHEDCQEKGWVLDGLGTGSGVKELEGAIVGVAEVSKYIVSLGRSTCMEYMTSYSALRRTSKNLSAAPSPL